MTRYIPHRPNVGRCGSNICLVKLQTDQAKKSGPSCQVVCPARMFMKSGSSMNDGIPIGNGFESRQRGMAQEAPILFVWGLPFIRICIYIGPSGLLRYSGNYGHGQFMIFNYQPIIEFTGIHPGKTFSSRECIYN